MNLLKKLTVLTSIAAVSFCGYAQAQPLIGKKHNQMITRIHR